ncbi:MAG: hypothetical protein MHM6MM_002175 [Cercozoa sp. M6MM]
MAVRGLGDVLFDRRQIDGDAQLVTVDGSVRAHLVVLSANSDYVQTAINFPQHQQQQCRLTVPASTRVTTLCLQCMYDKTVEETDLSKLAQVLQLCDFLLAHRARRSLLSHITFVARKHYRRSRITDESEQADQEQKHLQMAHLLNALCDLPEISGPVREDDVDAAVIRARAKEFLLFANGATDASLAELNENAIKHLFRPYRDPENRFRVLLLLTRRSAVLQYSEDEWAERLRELLEMPSLDEVDAVASTACEHLMRQLQSALSTFSDRQLRTESAANRKRFPSVLCDICLATRHNLNRYRFTSAFLG